VLADLVIIPVIGSGPSRPGGLPCRSFFKGYSGTSKSPMPICLDSRKKRGVLVTMDKGIKYLARSAIQQECTSFE